MAAHLMQILSIATPEVQQQQASSREPNNRSLDCRCLHNERTNASRISEQDQLSPESCAASRSCSFGGRSVVHHLGAKPKPASPQKPARKGVIPCFNRKRINTTQGRAPVRVGTRERERKEFGSSGQLLATAE